MVTDSHAPHPTDVATPSGQLAILLACFAGQKAAGKVRHPLEKKLRSAGDVVLDSTELSVNAKHKASVHDPRRMVAGTLVPALTWGLFGLLASGWQGLVIWAVLGAVCGAPFTWYSVHHASKAELAHIGAKLPAGSSALLTFAETSDPRRVLTATAGHQPSAASVAAIGDDLSATVFAGVENPVEVSRSSGAGSLPSDESSVLSMLVLRYPDPDQAKQAASQLAAANAKTGNDPTIQADDTEVELIIKTDKDGRRHVTDPKFGPAALAKSDLISWGLFGVAAGAIAGANGGGILKGGVVTGVAWGVFGLFAGALYGLWAGRSTTARRLKGIGRLLAPETSTLLAWADGPVRQHTVDTLTAPNSQRLVLRFAANERGALIEAA